MNFAYFVPLPMRLKIEDVKATGLGDVLRDRLTNTDLSGLGRLTVASITNGPDGHDGTLLQCRADIDPDEDSPPQPVGYFPKSQTWIKTGKYWTGYDPNALPTLADLQRDKTITGFDVTMENGETCHCPTIRMCDDKSNLPDVWRMVDGKFKSVTKPDWAWAWDLSGEVWDWFIEHGGVPTHQAFEWCVKLIGINYRIGPHEASLLGLLGSDSYPEVLQACISGPLIEFYRDQQKKRESVPTVDTATSCAGVGDY